MSEWETVIGLEIHAQLSTKTKLFSSTRYQYGEEPNTCIGPVNTAQPGTLPQLNREAVVKGVQFGLAIRADIQLVSSFDRKSYFYPDSPRNFQITQFYQPLILGGKIPTFVDGELKEFPIDRAHIEDDAGMLKHFTQFAGVDFNRAGVPLLEIVSLPNMRSAKEASAYAMSVRAILQFVGASNCNMEEGSMRMDANISVRKKGEKEFRPKVEVKNMNSFSNMELAISAEVERQIAAYTADESPDFEQVIKAGTYRFDPGTKKTFLMRRKEAAHDYRYFPEPDLPPLVLTKEFLEKIQRDLPELPQQKLARYREELALPEESAVILTSDKFTAEFFETALEKCSSPTLLSNWITVEIAGRLKEKGQSLLLSGLTPDSVGDLISMIEKKTITGRMAKEILTIMLENPSKSSRQIVEENPEYKPLTDTSAIEPLVDQVLENNPQSITDYFAGRTKALAFLVGQVMKETKGKASPDIVNSLLLKKMEEKRPS